MYANNMIERLEREARRILERREQREARRVAQDVVRRLNRGSLGLRDLVETWIASGYRLDRWTRRDVFEEGIRYRTISLQQHSGPVQFTADWGHFDPGTPTGIGDSHYEPPSEDKEVAEAEYEENRALVEEAKSRARTLTLFFRLITGRYYAAIGRCPRCKKFFLNTSGQSDKKYCSQRCASAETATIATQARRIYQHQRRIEMIRAASEKFSRLSPERQAKLNRRDWIHSQTKHSKKFITMILRKETL